MQSDYRLPFASIGEVCYDPNTGSTIMSKHTVFGSRIPQPTIRPKTSNGELKATFTPGGLDKCYLPATQVNRFPGKIQPNVGKVFVPGLLIPFADGYTKSASKNYMHYLNTMPIWKQIYENNWLEVENTVRRVAKDEGDTVVYTGGFEYQLVNLNDKLCPGNVRMPKWIYKIVMPVRNQRAIAFLTLNDPNASRPIKNPCQDVCQILGWLPQYRQFERNNIGKGYTICCLVEALKPIIPSLADVRYSLTMAVSLSNSEGELRDGRS
jgi:DNA/RNA non-specific endonuclease